MNLAETINMDKSEFIVLQSSYRKPVVFLGASLEHGDYLVIRKEDIPYVTNMFLKEECRIYVIRRKLHEHRETNGGAAIEFRHLPRIVRDEIRKKAPHTGTEDVFIVSKYGE